MFTVDGWALSSRHRFALMAGLWGLSFGLCRMMVASRLPRQKPRSSIKRTCSSSCGLLTWFRLHSGIRYEATAGRSALRPMAMSLHGEAGRSTHCFTDKLV